MNIKPFGNNILVKPVEKKQILIADSGSLCEYGVVVAIGDEVQKIKVGEIIGYLVWGISSLDLNGNKHYFVPESDEFILGVISDI